MDEGRCCEGVSFALGRMRREAMRGGEPGGGGFRLSRSAGVYW